MTGLNANSDVGSINDHDTCVVDQNQDDKCDANWFADVSRVLLPSKAGTALHYITGFDERTCQRYAAGHVKPPAFFFRKLLRSPQGWQFLAGAMEGSDAPWWVEINEALRLKRAVDGVRK